MKSLRILLVLGLLTSPGLSQTSKPDSQTQQQILDELRAIHRDLRASTTLQLLLAELQITQTALERSIAKRDALRAQVTQLQADKETAQAEVTRVQDGIDKSTNADVKEQFVGRLEELKDGLRKATAQVQGTSDQLQDAESRLRTAQAERENVQGQLSDLVKKLGSVN